MVMMRWSFESRALLFGGVLTIALLILTPAAFSEQAPPPPLPALKLELPQAGSVVSGELTIRVAVDLPEGAAQPRRMLAGFGGAPWVELEKQENLWTGIIDTTLVPNGSQTLRVITENRKVTASASVTVSNPLKVWFADLHSHSSYSDGTYLPRDAYKYAREVAKLDVFCLSDHLESIDANEWLDIREVAWKANETGHYVALVGLEWTKQWGHLNIYDPPHFRWPSDPEEFYKAAAQAGVVLKFNHPGDGTTAFGGLAYSEAGDRVVQLMEVRSNVEEQAFRRALQLGWHIAPEGSTDTHGPNWGNLRTWTGILAPGLSVRNILDALANRRCYSTGDRNCRVEFTINGQPMGSIIALPAARFHIRLALTDPDENDPISKVEFFLNNEPWETLEPNQNQVTFEKELAAPAGSHHLWVKITQADGNSIWCAPIWFSGSEN